jgi:hypothetical protein
VIAYTVVVRHLLVRRSGLAGDLKDPSDVREPEVADADHFESGHLDAAVAAVAGAVGHRDSVPGQGGAAVQQDGLVGLTVSS